MPLTDLVYSPQLGFAILPRRHQHVLVARPVPALHRSQAFYLHGAVADAKLRLQRLLQRFQKGIIRALGPHQVGR